MLIEVYDKVGVLLSAHKHDGSLTDFIKAEAGENYIEHFKPYTATLNGIEYPHDDHDKILNGSDVVVVVLEPAFDPATWVAIIIAIVSAAYSYYVTSNLEDYSSPEKPNSIYESSVRANKVKPNQLVREVAGSIPIFPDYICPPRRRFEDNIEYIYLMLSVGVGYFDISSRNLFIADTPISNYPGDIELEIFEPGDTVSGNIAHQNWYQALDVSSLSLKTTFDQPSGNWSAIFTAPDTIQFFVDSVAVAFPFDVGSILLFSDANIAANERFMRVETILTTTATDDTITVTIVDPETVTVGYDSQTIYNGDSDDTFVLTPVLGTIYNDTTDVLTSDTEAAIEWRAELGGVNWEGPFTLCPFGQNATAFEFEVRFPRGIGFLNNNGGFSSRTVDIEVQYRESGLGGDWLTVPATSYTDNTNNERGYTVTQSLASSYNPEVRFRRITDDATSTKQLDEVEITRVKALLESATSYSDVTTIALRIRATNALSRTAENRLAIVGATRKLPTLAEIEALASSGTPYSLTAENTATTNYYSMDDAAFLNARPVDLWVSGTATSNPLGAFFSDSGLNYYVALSNFVDSETVITSYPSASPYDVSSIDFSNPTISPAFTSTIDKVIDVFDGGTKLLVMENQIVYVYLMSVAYDVSSVSVTPSQIFSDVPISGEIFCRILGDKLFILIGSSAIRQYTMSTLNDVSTASYDSVSLDISGYFTVSPAVDEFFISDSKLILFDSFRNAFELDIVGGDLSSVTDSGGRYVFPVVLDSFSFNPDGSKMFAVSYPEENFILGGDVHTYASTTVVDSRSTSEIGRFMGYMLYDRIGNDLAEYVDWSEFAAFDTLTQARGDTLNAEFANESTVWDVSKLILSTGYAEPTIKNGKMTPVRTAAGTDYSHLYTPDIMMGEGVTTVAEHDSTEEPDGIIVEYLNNETGINETVNAFLAGDNGIRTKKIQAFGITGRTQAWRFGMRERERERNRPREYSFTTEMDGLNSFYGDAVGIVDELDAPQFGKVTAVSGATISTDQILTFLGSDLAFFRDDEGVCYGPFSVSAGASPNQITLDSPSSLGFTFGDYDVLFSMGTTDQVVKRAIIRNIQPSSDNTCDIVCEEYIAAIYQHDDLEPS